MSKNSETRIAQVEGERDRLNEVLNVTRQHVNQLQNQLDEASVANQAMTDRFLSEVNSHLETRMKAIRAERKVEQLQAQLNQMKQPATAPDEPTLEMVPVASLEETVQ